MGDVCGLDDRRDEDGDVEGLLAMDNAEGMGDAGDVAGTNWAPGMHCRFNRPGKRKFPLMKRTESVRCFCSERFSMVYGYFSKTSWGKWYGHGMEKGCSSFFNDCEVLSLTAF